MKKFRNPPTIHQPLAAYTHQIEISGKGRWLVLSGQVGMNRDGTVPGDAIEQLSNAWTNLERNLEAAKMQIDDLVKITFYLVGEMDAETRREFLTTKMKGHTPCMTLLYVSGLAHPSYTVEIDAWAYSPARD